ncbi:MAG: hypothetical protein A2V67_06270 [Deltaproteobacteria bacterium RBG_13_61_14]|nr:MAG: hypothetical protein A2V67_06270 [Deltaproteobacteria bacterium RBG_13_61_14]
MKMVGKIMIFLAMGYNALLYIFIEINLIRESWFNLINPFAYFAALWRLVSGLDFWVAIIIGLAGYGLVRLSEDANKEG